VLLQKSLLHGYLTVLSGQGASFFFGFFKVKAKAINMYRTALWLGTYLYHSFVVRFS